MKTGITIILTMLAVVFGVQSIHAADENREVSAFSEITLRVPAKVYLEQGEKQSIEITARESVLEEIITEVKGRELVIRFSTKSALFKDFDSAKIEIYITVPEIGALSVSGSGDIINDGPIDTRILDVAVSGSGNVMLDDLEAERVKVTVSGSGDVKLAGSGKTGDLSVAVSGSGNFRGIDFPAEDVEVKMSGSGNVDVYAENSLKVRAAGSGDVTYRGNPSIDQSILGSGKVLGYKK